nr:hypothetical protein [Deinococcus geothermalis]
MVKPVSGLTVEIGIVHELRPQPEVLLDVPDTAFHLALGPGPVRSAQPDGKAQPQGKIQELGVPDGLTGFVAFQDHLFGVVVQDALGHSAEIGERIEVAADEAGGVGLADELDVQRTGPAQHHHEGPDRAGLPFQIQVAVPSEVHLSLLARRGFKAGRDAGGGHLCPPKWADKVLDHRVLPLVPAFLHFTEQHHGTQHALLDATFQVGNVGIELAALFGAGFRLREGWFSQVLLDGVAAQVELAGDPTDGVTGGFEFDDASHLCASEHADLRFSRIVGRRGLLPRSGQFRSALPGHFYPAIVSTDGAH